MRFSQLDEVGVKCTGKRGRFPSQRWMAGVLCVDELSRIKCTFSSAGTLCSNQIQKPAELFPRTRAREGLAGHCAGPRIQRRQQAGDAVAFVIVRSPIGLSGTQGQQRRGTLQRLNPLFSSTHNTSARSEGSCTDPRYRALLSMHSGSLEGLKLSLRCGCKAKARPMRLTAVWFRPQAFAIERVDQCVAPAGLDSRKAPDHHFDLRVAELARSCLGGPIPGALPGLARPLRRRAACVHVPLPPPQR
jgi:hypothetical protein